MTIYAYRQNNSNGSWDYNLPSTLFIQASTEERAKTLAHGFGAYEGVKSGDCTDVQNCCGERWNWEGEIDATYMKFLNEAGQDASLIQEVAMIEGNYAMLLKPTETATEYPYEGLMDWSLIIDGVIEE